MPNFQYEKDWNVDILGDACDPDPCVSICLDSDPLAPQGECTSDYNHYLFGLEMMMGPTETVSTGISSLHHYDIASERRVEGQQVYWCSCYNVETGLWLEEEECKRETQCPEDGEQVFDVRTYIGWSEAIRENTMVHNYEHVECDWIRGSDCYCLNNPGGCRRRVPFECLDEDDSACPCSIHEEGCMELPPCSPTLSGEEADLRTCEFCGSDPKMNHRFGPYGPAGRVDSMVEDKFLLSERGIQYPENTPENIALGMYNRLKFWIKPVDVRGADFDMYNKETYWPPMSERLEESEIETRNWNNEYTAYQNILSGLIIPVGYNHLGGLSDGHFMRLLRDWRNGVPSGAKDQVIIPNFFYWNDGDCPPWLMDLCYFDVSPPQSALRGIAFIEFDARSKIFWGILPSRSTAGEMPGERGMAMTMMRLPDPAVALLPQQALVFTFGGENETGILSNTTWMAERSEEGAFGKAYYWSRLDVVGTPPPARKNALMFTDPLDTRVFLFGGEGEEEFLDDLWVLAPADGGVIAYSEDGGSAPDGVVWAWESLQPVGDLPSARAAAAVSVNVGEAAIYGGLTAQGPSGDVFIFNPSDISFKKATPSDGTSLVRQGASIEYDTYEKNLYLFGGTSSDDLHNDLWKFDLKSQVWTNLLPECTLGNCPPLADDSILVKDSVSGSLTVLPGQIAESKDIYYVAGAYGWTGQAESEGSERMKDCDGDGYMEEEYGKLCPTGDAWWSAPGKNVCDSSTGSIACSPASVTGQNIGQIHVPSANSIAVQDSLLWVTRANRLECHDVSDPSSPLLISSLVLPGRARDVVVAHEHAFVASDRRILSIDVSDPSSPYVVSEIATCGQAKSVEVLGNLLAVASSGGIGLLDISNPGELWGLGMLWVMEAGPRIWTFEESMEECGRLCDGEQAVIDIVFMFSEFGRNLEAQGEYVFSNSMHNLLSFDVDTDLGMPLLIDSIAYRGRVDKMRVHYPFAYITLRNGEGRLVKIDDMAALEKAGSHDVEWWVKGLEIEGSRAYVLDRNKVRIGEIVPSGDWPW